ncbi:GNAT family N-acetyltransferase [Kribbella deserti]|uniref:GNAT family N-acetyltransferase n=1 Tax=Kribbella deserti TaxID=1926257 RepID=A0ABV6QU10_9ACTN
MGTTQVWPGGATARALTKPDTKDWAELLAAAEAVDQTGENYSVEDLDEELDDPKVNTETDTIGLWLDGVLVGYGVVRGPDEVVDVHRVQTEGTIHPDWRRRGLGSALLTWLVERATDVHRERQPAAVGEVNTSVPSTHGIARDMLTARGFEPCRYFFLMQRDLGTGPVPATPLPDGLRLVAFDWKYDEALRLAHNDAFLDHWGSTPKDAETWKTWFTGSRAFRPDTSVVVLDGDEIAAYTLGYEYEADTAATGVREVYVGQVGTRRAYRGKGAARAALAQVLRQAEDLGYQRSSLDVDGENPTGALGLYQSLGYVTTKQTIRHRKAIS